MRLADDRRSSLLRMVHAEARRRGLDDLNYRSIVRRAAGADSCKDLEAGDLQRVLDLIRGGAPQGRGRAPAAGPIPGKVRALVLSLWNLGAWESEPTDRSIGAFVKRQTGVDDVRFLTPETMSSVIEALRAMCARAGFAVPPNVAPRAAQALLARAQHARLFGLSPQVARGYAGRLALIRAMSDQELRDLIRAMGESIRALAPPQEGTCAS